MDRHAISIGMIKDVYTFSYFNCLEISITLHKLTISTVRYNWYFKIAVIPDWANSEFVQRPSISILKYNVFDNYFAHYA